MTASSQCITQISVEYAQYIVILSSVQFSRSVMSDSLQPQASLSITNSQSSPRLTSIELVMPSSHLILCHPLLLLPPILPSIFSNESTLLMRWPKYWSFSFSIIPAGKQWMVAKLWLFYRLNIHWLLVKADSIFVGKISNILESLGLQGDPTSPFWRGSALGFLWKEWC